MFFFIINGIEYSPDKKKGDSQAKIDKLNSFFQYIRRLCPQRTEKKISYATLISKMRKKFRMDESSVQSILKRFLDENILLVGYDDEVSINILANKNRKEIMALISQFPGVYINFIKRKLNLNPRQLLWHLAFLIKFKMIIEYSIGKIKAYGEADVPSEHVLLGFVILKQSLRVIIQALMDFPLGLTNLDLADNLNIPKNTSSYSLQKLEKIEIIFSEKDGNRKKYFIKKELVAFSKIALQKFELIKC